MAELTEAAEAVEEIVEEVVEAVRIPNVKLIAVAAWGVGIVGGTALGYLLAKNRLETKYAQLANAEVEDMRQHFLAREVAHQPKPELKDLAEGVLPEGEEIVAISPMGKPRVQYGSPEEVIVGEKTAPESDDQPPVKSHYGGPTNVFDNPPAQDDSGTWDYSVETKARKANPDVPYVIHRDEMGEEGGWDTVTITYYAGDDVLADERDEEIQNREELIGPEALTRFGHGSNDPMIVLVRNTRIEQEFEIVHSEGKYIHEVMGHPEEDELRHSSIPRRSRPWADG